MVDDTLSSSLEASIHLAITKHMGQRDKAGEPYILHLLRVMSNVEGHVAKQAAVLHDIVEDTSTTFSELENAGVSPAAVEAVRLLTHDPNILYSEYVESLSGNPIARSVKIADIEDNYRIGRVAYRDEFRDEDARRLQRYILTHQFLTQGISLEEYRRRMAGVEG